jgi:DnaJ-class molecular chaperone
MNERRCPDCAGDGWDYGLDTECCGMADEECGGRGCIGPVECQVQVPCETCRGTGAVPDWEAA